jgi:trans-2-enoyl-CoA reductase
MNTIIEVTLKNDKNKEKKSFSVFFNNEEVLALAQKKGLKAANKALDSFSKKFFEQYKEELASYLGDSLGK